MRTYAKHSTIVTYREKRALANAQEETRQKSADKVVGNSGQGGDEAPKDHANGEVYGRLPNIIEEHVPIHWSAEVSKTSGLGRE